MKVFVYFNLHKRCFSIKSLEGENKGRVVAHADKVMLYDGTFKVSQAGRKRVLSEKRKNVHAGVVGLWYGTNDHNDRSVDLMSRLGKPITYNPYKYETFVSVYGETPQHSASKVGILVIGNDASQRKGYIYCAD